MTSILRRLRRSRADASLLPEVLAEEPPPGTADLPVDLVLDSPIAMAASFVHLVFIAIVIAGFAITGSLVGLAVIGIVLISSFVILAVSFFGAARSVHVSEEGIRVDKIRSSTTLPWWEVTQVEAKPDLSAFRASSDGGKRLWACRRVSREKRKDLAVALRARLLARGLDLQPIPGPSRLVRARNAALGLSVMAVFIGFEVWSAPSAHLASGCTWSTRAAATVDSAAAGASPYAVPSPAPSAVLRSSTGRSVRIVALGDFPQPLLQRLQTYFSVEHGIPLTVLAPVPLSDQVVDTKRDQVVDDRLLVLLPPADAASTVTIGITRYDMEIASIPRWRFGFSSRAGNDAIVSTARMDPRCLGDASNEDLLFQRTMKMVGKDIGVLYLGLPPSTDPRSIMYNNILSVGDLDRMQDSLPTQ